MSIGLFPLIWPGGAAKRHRTGRAMDVILHIGAHRCATTTFQSYLRRNADRLAAQGIGFWGPLRTRGGLLRGVMPVSGRGVWRLPRRRAALRIRLSLIRREQRGLETLVVSDENILGSMRDNRSDADLYPRAERRVKRHAAAFGDRLRTVVLNIRSLDTYWASALGYGVARGFGLPDPETMAAIARNARGWREVITDVARAAPAAEVLVLPFESFAGHPDAQLAALTRCQPPRAHARDWLNATPGLPDLRSKLEPNQAARLPGRGGAWLPFAPDQVTALRDRYAEDMRWLAAGADGLARLVTDDVENAGVNPRTGMTRGRRNDQDQGRLEGAGRERAARPPA